MCDWIKKEQAFLEMNEKLNKISMQKNSTVASPTKEKDSKVPKKADNHLNTYVRTKGLSTFLKKQGGAGDFTQSPKKPNSPSKTKNKQDNELVLKFKNPNYTKSPSLDWLNSVNNEPEEKEEDQATKEIHSKLSIIAPQPSRVNVVNKTNASKGKLSTEGMLKFLKSKVGILEEDQVNLTRELSKQKETAEQALERCKALESQRDQAFSKANHLKEQVQKMEVQLEEACSRLKEKSQIQLQLQKETEELKRELKVITQSNANFEKRLHRANEEIESQKSTISTIKESEREYRDLVRVEIENKEKALKNHRKMKSELLNAMRKQMYLIDNLGRQNVCLEQVACLTVTEKDFIKFLDQKPFE